MMTDDQGTAQPRPGPRTCGTTAVTVKDADPPHQPVKIIARAVGGRALLSVGMADAEAAAAGVRVAVSLVASWPVDTETTDH